MDDSGFSPPGRGLLPASPGQPERTKPGSPPEVRLQYPDSHSGFSELVGPEKRLAPMTGIRPGPALKVEYVLSPEWMVPDVAPSRRRINLEIVDFPHPDSPTRPKVSPSATEKLTSSTAFTWPATLDQIPAIQGKISSNPEHRATPLSFTCLGVFPAVHQMVFIKLDRGRIRFFPAWIVSPGATRRKDAVLRQFVQGRRLSVDGGQAGHVSSTFGTDRRRAWVYG